MVVQVDKAYIDEVGKQLTLQIAQALKNGDLPMDDLPEVSAMILDQIDLQTNHDQLISFLEKLQTRWPFFETLLMIERGKAAERQTDKKIEEMRELIETHNEKVTSPAAGVAQAI